MSWLRELIELTVREQREHHKRVEAKLDHILERINQSEHTMSQDLKDAVTRITTATQRIITDAITKLNQPDPDVAGAVSALNDLSTQLDNESAILEGNGDQGNG